MQVFKDLFTSDVGLMSAATIGIVIAMSVFFTVYFRKCMREDEAKARAQGR